MTQWEILENWIVVNGRANGHFTAEEVALDLGEPTYFATRLIQSYINVQTRPGSPTAYILHREGRTRAAVWHAGDRTLDGDMLTTQENDDMRWRYDHFTKPSLDRLVDINPATAPLVAVYETAFEFVLNQLDAMLTAASSSSSGGSTP